MNIPIPAETPDPNIDDPTLPPAVPEEDPDELPVKPTVPPTVGDPPVEEPPMKGGGGTAAKRPIAGKASYHLEQSS